MTVQNNHPGQPEGQLEQITPRLRKLGNFYEVDGEPIRRMVGCPHVERRPLQVLWDLRESTRVLLGGELPDDTYEDEPIRKTVGKARPR